MRLSLVGPLTTQNASLQILVVPLIAAVAVSSAAAEKDIPILISGKHLPFR